MKKISFMIFLMAITGSMKAQQMFTDITPESGLTNGYFSTIQFADLDNDGDPDIIISSEEGMTIFYNDDLDFTRTQSFPDYLTERQAPSVMDLGDFNLDGRVDILSGAGPNYSTFRVVLNNDPDFSESTGAASVGVIRGPAAFGDYDNDGDLDVLRAGYPTICENVGDSLIGSFYAQPFSDIYTQEWVDLDKDGRVEMFSSGGYYSNDTYIERIDSASHFPKLTHLENIHSNGARFADIDADGDMDMLLRWEFWQIYYNNNGTFTAGPTFPWSSTAEIADMNNDGKYDIVIGGGMDTWQVFQVQIHANNGDGTFTKIADTGMTDSGNERPDIDLGDVDHDGDLDVAIVLPNKVYRNDSPENAPPGVPVSLSETVNSIYAMFHWTAPSDDHTTANGLTYNVDVRKADGTIVTPSHSLEDGTRMITKMGNAYNNNFYRLGCLQEGSYKWKVQALDASYAGSEFSAERLFTVSNAKPAAPGNLKATGITDRAVKLTWNDVSTAETAYVIKKKAAFDNKYYDIDTIPRNSTSYVDSVFTEPKTSYDYRVVAYNCAYKSEFGVNITGTTLPMLFEESDEVPVISAQTKVLLGDADNDGDLDAFVTNNGAGSNVLLKYNGTAFEDSGIQFQQINFPESLQWVDINNDGFLDISVNFSLVLINHNGTSFTSANPTTDPVFGKVYDTRPSWGDYDLDGDLDVLVLGTSEQDPYNPATMLYENRGNLNFVKQNATLPTTIVTNNPWKDYDLDGDLDIMGFKTEGCSSRLFIYENDGNGNFTEKPTILNNLNPSPWDNYGNAAWINANGDGYPDIIYGGHVNCDSNAGSVTILINDKNKVFSISDKAGVIPDLYGDVNIQAGDIDLDGQQDLVIAGDSYFNSTLETRVFLNKSGAYERTTVNNVVPLNDYGNMQIGDSDQDGDLDLVIAGERNYATDVMLGYRNNIMEAWGATNESPAIPTDLSAQTSEGVVTFSWSASTDDTTPQAAITYDVFVMIDGDTVLSSSSTSEGRRKLPEDGNAGSSTVKIFKTKKTGVITWGVQAIDASYAASAFNVSEITLTEAEITGLGDEAASFEVYPNPAKDKIFVKGSAGSPHMYDVVGRRIMPAVNQLDGLYEISTKDMIAGLYVLRIPVGNKWYSRKIIVEK